MYIDERKLERQQKAVYNWLKETNARGGLVMPTGFGKTMIGKIALDRYFHSTVIEATDAIITVTSPALIENWGKMLKDTDYGHKVNIITRSQYFNDQRLRMCGLHIIDEVHEFYEDASFSIIDGYYVQSRFTLWLSATPEDPRGRHRKLYSLYPIADIVTEQEALANRWISKFIEYNLGVSLDNIDIYKEVVDPETKETKSLTRAEYYRFLSDHIALLSAKFGNHGLDLAKKILNGHEGIDEKTGKFFKHDGMAYATMWAKNMGWCSDLDYNNEEERKIHEQWNPKIVMGYATNLFKYIRLRKLMLYDAIEKIEPAVSVINKFSNRKFITFSQSTKFADMLCGAINASNNKEICTIYHSNIKSRPLKDGNGNYYVYKTGKKKGEPKLFSPAKLKEFAIEALRIGLVRGIATASALDKGFDVNDISLAVTCSGTSNYNQQIQRTGRAKRVDMYNPDEIVIIVNIFIKDTKDYDWLRERQKKSTARIKWVGSVEEIDFVQVVKPKLSFNL